MIDSHHHLWEFQEPEFSWLEPSLKRSFEAADLEQTLANTGVTGAVAVQARCSLDENEYLLQQAQQTDLIKGIVGWADLGASDVSDVLDGIAEQSLIKGVREIIQGAEDSKFLANDEFNRGVRMLESRGLSYDLLIFADQLEAAHSFVSAHSSLAMVLDHCAKPCIKRSQFPDDWAKGIQKLAEHENLCCKLSGLVTEIQDDSAFSAELIRPYFDTVLAAFGADRVMFGSDWPVSLSKASYKDWVVCVQSLITELSADEQQAILSQNATRFYRL